MAGKSTTDHRHLNIGLELDHDLKIDFVPLARDNSDLLQLAVRIHDLATQQDIAVISIDDVLNNTQKTIRLQAGDLYPAALLMIASELDRLSDRIKKSAGALPIEMTRAGNA